MVLTGRWSLIVFTAALALAAVGVWSISLRADGGPGAVGAVGSSPVAPRFTVTSGPLGGANASLGVFIVDAQTMRLLVYAVDGATRQLKLVAVRDISEDVRMSHYNNDKPWPEEIRGRIQAGGAAAPASDSKPEGPAKP